MGREVAPGDPALHRARVPLAHAPRVDGDRLLRDPLHRALPTGHLRLQPRRAPLDLAGRLLLVRSTRHRSLPAVHARRRARLPRAARGSVSRDALSRPRPREVVAARDPAVHARRSLPRVGELGRIPPGLVGWLGLVGSRARPHRHPRALRRHCARLPRHLPPRDLRLRARARPLGCPRRRLRAPHARRVSAVQARPGRRRSGRSLRADTRCGDRGGARRGGAGAARWRHRRQGRAHRRRRHRRDLRVRLSRKRMRARRGRPDAARRRRLSHVPEPRVHDVDVRDRVRERGPRHGRGRMGAGHVPRHRSDPQRERSCRVPRHRAGRRRSTVTSLESSATRSTISTRAAIPGSPDVRVVRPRPLRERKSSGRRR